MHFAVHLKLKLGGVSGGGGWQGEEGAGVGTVENIVNANLAVSILLK